MRLALAALVFFVLLWLRTLVGARSELQLAAESERSGDLVGAELHLRRAAYWSAPLNPYSDAAAAGLAAHNPASAAEVEAAKRSVWRPGSKITFALMVLVITIATVVVAWFGVSWIGSWGHELRQERAKWTFAIGALLLGVALRFA